MTGKERYEQINIPSGLSGVIQQARQRARKQKRRKMMIWRSSSLVAACAAVMITANVPGVAKALSDVPVIGSVVKILQVGGGGERTDGVSVTTTKESDTLNIHFQIDGEQITSAPSYTVDHKEGPNRLIFTFNGVRHLDYGKLEKDIKALKNVKDVYQNIILDDSAIGFVVELKDHVKYSVSEYQQPGYIQLKLFPTGRQRNRMNFSLSVAKTWSRAKHWPCWLNSILPMAAALCRLKMENSPSLWEASKIVQMQRNI